jgi:membrane fusion protein, copper/silver efflux system
MKFLSRSTLPWLLTVLLAVAFVVLAFSRKERSKGGTAAAAAPASPPASRLTPAARKVLYWVDPMVPGYKSDKPGKSPFMDMELVPVYEDGTSGETKEHAADGYVPVTVSMERQQAIGVRLGKAEMRDLTKTIRTVGRVTLDETLNHQIHSKFEGYVERLFVDYTGKPVRKGQPLLSIYSPELLATQQEYLLASRARRQFLGSSNPDLARAGVDLLDSARQRLLLWDISPRQIAELERTGKPQKALTLYSPVDGFVMTKNVVQGARVMPADTLFEIAGIRDVWVQADVYESEAPFVTLGQTAKMSLAYLPGRSWTGKVAFIAPVLDEKTRTIKVRIEFQNPDGVLKPEMYADVTLEKPLGRVLTVPDGAVLSTGTRAIVFVAKGEGRFEPRVVQTGANVDGYYEIREGIVAGDDVVTQANFLIDSESRLKAALAGMSAPAAGGSPATRETPHGPASSAEAPQGAKAEHQH